MAALNVHAAQITYEFSVNVTGIYDFIDNVPHELASTVYPVGGVVRLGDTFHGQFSFDASKLQMPAAMQTPTSRYYYGPAGSALGFSFSTPGGATYHSQPLNDGSIQLEHSAYDYFGIVDGGSPVRAALVLANWNGGAFDSLALPSAMKLTDFNYSWFRTSWYTGTGSIAIDGKVTALVAVVEETNVPEPATWAMLLLALAGMGIGNSLFGQRRT